MNLSTRMGSALLLAMVATAAGAASSLVDQTIASAHGAHLIPDQYLVQLKKPAAGDVLAGLALADQADALVAGVGGGRVLHVYDIVLRGFAVQVTAVQADLLRAHPLVARVEQDQRLRAVATQSNPPTYGLDRIDQRNLPLDARFNYADNPGQGAHVFVIDTGLNASHTDFTGRVGDNRNFVSGQAATAWADCHGHGTHVMGSAAGTSFGVAKKATLHAARVLDCGGSGSGADIIAGMNWVAGHSGGLKVANMSLGTQYIPFVSQGDASIDTAARNLVNANVATAVAAGNDSTSSCNTSPAREPAVLTVGATTSTDAKASYSNYGTCNDLFAPGDNIVSASHSAPNGGSTSMSGTSMASPFVAGALAVKRAQNPGMTSVQAQNAVVADTTAGKVTSAGSGSPNKLLYVPNTGSTPPPDAFPVAGFTSSCTGLSCTFTSTSTDDKGIASTSWAFGDSTSGTGTPVSHTYAAANTYTVTLTVTDTVGQSNARNATVTVTAGGGGPCADCTKVSGSLASGGTAYSPAAGGFTSSGGQFKGYLRGPAGTDFDLYLEKYSSGILGGWSAVASAEGTTSSEDIVYSGTSGTYRWRIKSYSGAGAYDFYFKHP